MARQGGLPSLAGMLSYPPRHPSAPVRFSLRAVAAAALLLAFASGPVSAQAPAAPVTAAAPIQAQDLEQLVAPIALYPDDLIAIILPASTNPLQIVQADRFLDQRKANPKLELNAQWDDAVKTLCNYPDIVKKMSQDLDWTSQLGEAVVADTGEVMEAIQAFRRRAQSAGNLKSDDKQTVVVEQNTITIAPANPEVVYVPQYNPQTVVVAGAYPTYPYYPAPYPAYWYPYAPGAALAGAVIWGAALGAIWSGGHYVNHYGGGGNNTINIDRGDRNTTINRGGDRTNVGSGNRTNSGNRGNQATQWKSDKKPGQVSGSVGSGNRGARAGDARTSGAGAGNLGGGGGGNFGGGAGGAGGGRPSTQPSGGFSGGGGAGGGARPSPQPSGGGGFEGVGSARQTQMDSSRGAASRGAAGSSGGRAPSAAPRPSGGGGGAARGGGGGARGGGGGGRGGGGGGRR